MQSAPAITTFKDKLTEGLSLLVIGVALLLATVWLLMADDLPADFVRHFTLALGSIGMGAALLGLRWARRRVELSEAGLSIVSFGKPFTIVTDAVASVRVRQEFSPTASARMPALIMTVEDGDGRTARVTVRTAEHATYTQKWLDLVCEKLLARWKAQLDSGGTVKVAKQIELVGSSLVRKRTRIELDGTFEIQEVPATTHGHALLTITSGSQRLILESHEENHPVLRRFLLSKLGTR